MSNAKFILICLSVIIIIGFFKTYSFQSKEPTDIITENLSADPADLNHTSKEDINLNKTTEQGYEILNGAFEGRPKIATIKSLIEPVMNSYSLEVNYTNLNKVGSCLISLKQKSAVGITEMDILKAMYQNNTSSKNFPEQATIAWYYLEKTK